MRREDIIIKYPRTPHIQGSRLQPGDEDLRQRPFSDIEGRHIVLEEKIDGANTAISFNDDGELRLQSRGHFLTGGGREKHYDLLKQWGAVHKDRLWEVLGDRYIMYGEWMYAKHTIYYDLLPNYFMEFDILDRETDKFLDTPSRQALISDLPVSSCPVLASGKFSRIEDILKYLGDSNYISDDHISHLREDAERLGLDADRICRETDASRTMEGIYIKVEENGEVVDNLAKEQAKEYLRRHQPFVWNATNLTADTRRKLISLFESYKARVRIVYLETDWQTQLARNASRPDQVPISVIISMLAKLTPPEAHEASTVKWITV